MGKIAVLIDVQNLYHSAKLFCNGKISYKHLMEKIGEGREVVYSKAYAAHKDVKESKSFYSALELLGIEVLSKKVVVEHDKNNQSKVIPVHFDVEIATDAAINVPVDVDTIVFCTGNGNFCYLADHLINVDGTKIEFWSFSESTSNDIMSNEKFTFRQIPTECLLGHTPEEVETKKAVTV